jgi:hypothetical protein
LGTPEYFYYNCCVAGIVKCRQSCVDNEIVEKPLPLLEFMLANSRWPNWAVKRERTNLQVIDGIFLSWPGDTADRIQ